MICYIWCYRMDEIDQYSYRQSYGERRKSRYYQLSSYLTVEYKSEKADDPIKYLYCKTMWKSSFSKSVKNEFSQCCEERQCFVRFSEIQTQYSKQVMRLKFIIKSPRWKENQRCVPAIPLKNRSKGVTIE